MPRPAKRVRAEEEAKTTGRSKNQGKASGTQAKKRYNKAKSLRAAAKQKAALRHYRELKKKAKSPSGRARTLEETRQMLLLLLNMYLWAAAQNEDGVPKEVTAYMTVTLAHITWTPIIKCASRMLGWSHVSTRNILDHYLKDGLIYVASTAHRGKGSPNYIDHGKKLSAAHLAELDRYTLEHSANINVRRITKHMNEHFPNFTFKKTTIRYALVNFLHFEHTDVKCRKSKVDPGRIEQVKTFLRDFAVAIEKEKAGTHVLVYTDESYIHQNHCPDRSWIKRDSDGRVNRGSSKGRRLIILHAITKDGPLATKSADGVPIQGCDWYKRKSNGEKTNRQGDTPHPLEGEVLTCELLWVADSHTGDYHDNMNSEMYMQWVEKRLTPTFKKLFPNKKMILIQDNAPYHHNRGIPALSTIATKKKMLELIRKHGVTQINLPLSNRRLSTTTVDVTDNFLKSARGAAEPNVPTMEEMKAGFLAAIKSDPQKKELLNCKIEKHLKSQAWEILWTPPYCPKLQPIELFWAAGKNWAAEEYMDKRTMRQCVEHLREGWYGNADKKKSAASCAKLVDHAKKEATILIKKDAIIGLSGTIDNLVIAPGIEFIDLTVATATDHIINEDTVTGEGALAIELGDGFVAADGGLDLNVVVDI